jgi:hypothetical protein
MDWCPAGYPPPPSGGPASWSWFPAAFRPPALASRSSFTRRGVGPSSRSAYRPDGRTSTGLPRSAHTSCDRVGRPLCPGDNGAHPDRGHFPASVCRFTTDLSLHPTTLPIGGDLVDEASTKGSHVFARPVFPSPVAARMERAALGHEPRASHPADQEPDDARRDRDRPSSTDLELLAQLTISSISNPVVLS